MDDPTLETVVKRGKVGRLPYSILVLAVKVGRWPYFLSAILGHVYTYRSLTKKPGALPGGTHTGDESTRRIERRAAARDVGKLVG